MGRPKTDTYERFWSYVDMGQPNECWPWLGGIRNEYGAFSVNNKTVYSHRFAYEATGVKLIHDAHHECENKLCCNPAHIEDKPKSNHMSYHHLGKTGGAGKYSYVTHCKRGHEFNESNTRIDKNGKRICRTCKRENQILYHNGYSHLIKR